MADLEHLAPEELRDAHQIPVDHLEIALLLPILIQAKKRDDDSFVDPRSDPDTNHDFLDHWVKDITDPKHLAGGNTGWTEILGGYPPVEGEETEPAYSEFCYFHPFVRNFLYVTRGDIRTFEKKKSKREGRTAPPSVSAQKKLIEDAPNRSLRIFERHGLKELQIEYELDRCQHKSVFSIDSCWLYLFDTQVAMLELRLRHERSEKARNAEEMSSSSVPSAPGSGPGEGGRDPEIISSALPSGTSAPASADAVQGDQGQLDLRKVLKIQDIIRRLYSPYWDTFSAKDKVQHVDVHVPQRMTLVFDKQDGENAPRSVASSFGNFTTAKSTLAKVKRADFSGVGETCEGAAAAENHLRNVFYEREPYTVGVWRALLWPLLPTTCEPGTEGEFPLCFEHIQDDRAMLMSHIAVGDPAAWNALTEKQQETTPRDVRRIRTGDWLRLATVDDPGDSNRYPYSPLFFKDAKNPLADFAYDRFWHPTGEAPGQDSYQTTRWLCCGYGFVGVGDAADTAFFKNEHSGALCHFRHHYFALAMIAQFHRSSLLNYKHAWPKRPTPC